MMALKQRKLELYDAVMVGVVGGFGASMKAPGHAHHNGMELVRLGEFGGRREIVLRHAAAGSGDAPGENHPDASKTH